MVKHENAALDLMNAGVDLVYLIGEETRVTRDVLLGSGEGTGMVAGWYETCEQAIPDLLEAVDEGDFILLKASRFYELEKVAQALRKARGGGEG